MGVYTGQAGGWYGNISGGRTSAGGTGPGGPDQSIQINDGGNFNGTGEGTYLGAIGFQINNTILFSRTATNANDIFFLFPTSIAQSLELRYGASTQLELHNNSVTEQVYFNFNSEFYSPTLSEARISTYQNAMNTLSPSSSTLFDDGGG